MCDFNIWTILEDLKVELKHLTSEKQWAKILTKSLGKINFHDLREQRVKDVENHLHV